MSKMIRKTVQQSVVTAIVEPAMTDPAIIWLSPSCDEGQCRDECTWCVDNIYDPCSECGKLATRYRLDDRGNNPSITNTGEVFDVENDS